MGLQGAIHVTIHWHDHFKPLLQLADAVIVTNEQHRILAVNDTYEQITGYYQESIIGKKAGILRTPYTPISTYDSMKAVLKARQPWSGVFTNYKKNRQLWHSSITITPYIIEGETYYVGVFRELEQLARGYYLDEGRVWQIQESLLRVLAISCEIRDPGIEAHLTRVQELTGLLINRHNERCNLGLSDEYIMHVIHSSILHDIGKSGIPEGILYKPGSLSYYERAIIEMHTEMGVDILRKIFSEFDDELIQREYTTSRNIILHHHEKWDGTGYPHKLSGTDIPLEARIVSVVDVLDALVTKRAYKDRWQLRDAVAYLKDQRGMHFDADIVDSLVTLYEDGSLKKIGDFE